MAAPPTSEVRGQGTKCSGLTMGADDGRTMGRSKKGVVDFARDGGNIGTMMSE